MYIPAYVVIVLKYIDNISAILVRLGILCVLSYSQCLTLRDPMGTVAHQTPLESYMEFSRQDY